MVRYPYQYELLGAHFKISSNGCNLFEKQKVWGEGSNKNKEEFQDPAICFTIAIATDTNTEELILRVVHEWHRMGEVRLQIKELQTFESKTILLLLNIFTAPNKKILIAELHGILTAAQSQIQGQDPTKIWWGLEDTVTNSSFPPLKLCLQNPKLPGQDLSYFNKLSWRIQAN